LAAFDFKNKRVLATQFIQLTGNEDADMATITKHYANIANGCVPSKQGAITLKR
jgi:hypothetical protein